MTAERTGPELVARFTKRFRNGPTIEADLRQPTQGFSCTVLFGPSGGGKTTVLRCLAGLEQPDAGTIAFGSEVWCDVDRRIFRRSQARNVGFVFQDYALFPHLTVAENIGYGLRQTPQAARTSRVTEIMQRLGLEGLGQRRPHQISGGQQQRVALARTLARQPRLLLLDEPLSALDHELRDDVRRELRTILRAFNIPTVLVTHDRLEAMTLADQLVLLDNGRVLQSGAVREIFARPASTTAARIVGVENILAAEPILTENGRTRLRIGSAELVAESLSRSTAPVHACIRAEDVAVHAGTEGEAAGPNHLRARVVSFIDEGLTLRLELDCGFRLIAVTARRLHDSFAFAVGDEIKVAIDPQAIHIVPS